jgi:hypothetical protein
MFAFIKRNKSDGKMFASQNLYDIFSDLHGKDSKTLICNRHLPGKSAHNTVKLIFVFYLINT